MPKRGDLMVEEIKAWIAERRLAPGDRLPKEAELQALFGVLIGAGLVAAGVVTHRVYLEAAGAVVLVLSVLWAVVNWRQHVTRTRTTRSRTLNQQSIVMRSQWPSAYSLPIGLRHAARGPSRWPDRLACTLSNTSGNRRSV